MLQTFVSTGFWHCRLDRLIECEQKTSKLATLMTRAYKRKIAWHPVGLLEIFLEIADILKAGF